MTFPAIFYATGDWRSAAAGCIGALALSFFGKSLLQVAACSCLLALAVELLVRFL